MFNHDVIITMKKSSDLGFGPRNKASYSNVCYCVPGNFIGVFERKAISGMLSLI